MEIRNRDSPTERGTAKAGIPLRYLKEEETNVCS